MYEKTDLKKKYFRRAPEPVFYTKMDRIQSVRLIRDDVSGNQQKREVGVDDPLPETEADAETDVEAAKEPRF